MKMKKYIHQMAALAIFVCLQLSSKANLQLQDHSISLSYLAHDSDSEGIFLTELTQIGRAHV